MSRRPDFNRAARRASRGAALLAAMLTVALVASFAAAALWQQWRSVEVESADRKRVEASWLLTGGLDWARQILREDAQSGAVDHLAEPWAAPLREISLSSFLAADKGTSAAGTAGNAGNAGGLPDASLSSRIEDMQSRLNLRNLLDGDRLSKADMLCFARLFSTLNLPQAELVALADKLRLAADSNDNAAGTAVPMVPQRIEQLAWLGVSAATIARLRPYVSVLPVRTPINLNTAGAEVLYAGIPGLTIAQAKGMVEERSRRPFPSLKEAGRLAGLKPEVMNDGAQSVGSRFFEVRQGLRRESLLTEERALLQRDAIEVKTLWRERAPQDAAPPNNPAGQSQR